MFEYMLGLGLLTAGTFSFLKSLGQLDNTGPLKVFRTLFPVLNVSFLISGFFVFPWYVPLLGFWVVSALLGVVVLPLLSGFILRDHLAVVIGAGLCSYALV